MEKTLESFIDTFILEPIENFLEKGGVPMFRQKRGMSPLTAGFMGLLIGAAGTAIGITMTDEKNRKIVADKAKQLADISKDKMQNMRQTATHMLNSTAEDIKDMKKNAKQARKAE